MNASASGPEGQVAGSNKSNRQKNLDRPLRLGKPNMKNQVL